MSTTEVRLPLMEHLIGMMIDANHNCDICKEENMRYAVVLKTDETAEIVPFPTEVSEQADILSEKVGGLFTTVNVLNEEGSEVEFTLWVNDEGLLLGLPFNKAASELQAVGYHRRGMTEDEARANSYLVGDAVITYGPDEEGDTEGFDKEKAEELIKLLKKMRVIKKG